MTVEEIENYACDVLKDQLKETEGLLVLYQNKQATHSRWLCWGVYTEHHLPEYVKAGRKVEDLLEKRASLKAAITALEMKYGVQKYMVVNHSADGSSILASGLSYSEARAVVKDWSTEADADMGDNGTVGYTMYGGMLELVEE